MVRGRLPSIWLPVPAPLESPGIRLLPTPPRHGLGFVLQKAPRHDLGEGSEAPDADWLCFAWTSGRTCPEPWPTVRPAPCLRNLHRVNKFLAKLGSSCAAAIGFVLRGRDRFKFAGPAIDATRSLAIRRQRDTAPMGSSCDRAFCDAGRQGPGRPSRRRPSSSPDLPTMFRNRIRVRTGMLVMIGQFAKASPIRIDVRILGAIRPTDARSAGGTGRRG